MNDENAMIIEIAKADLGITEEIHTFAEWKRLGFCVKKGEKAACKIDIWNRATSKNKDEEEVADDGYFYTKKAAFFKASQVQLIENNQ